MALSPDSYPTIDGPANAAWGGYLGDVQQGMQPGPGGIVHLDNIWGGAIAAAVATGVMSPSEYPGVLHLK